MDVIIDTNIIVAENFFRSSKFKILFDYLKTTSSKIVLPQIVKEESIQNYNQLVSSNLEKVKKNTKLLANYCFSSIEMPFDIDVNKEVNSYSCHIENLKKDDLLYEIDYTDVFLHEIVTRAINRIKPIDKNGQQFRDVILWLSIKKLLKESSMISAAFISNDTKEFASADKANLHPDLEKEMSDEDISLKYYTSLDHFIENHANKIEYITKEWITSEIERFDLKDLIDSYFLKKGEAEFIQHFDIGVAYVYPLSSTIDEDYINFYEYEMADGKIFLFINYSGDMQVEIGLEDGQIDHFEIEIFPKFMAEIVDEKILELVVDGIMDMTINYEHQL